MRRHPHPSVYGDIPRLVMLIVICTSSIFQKNGYELKLKKGIPLCHQLYYTAATSRFMWLFQFKNDSKKKVYNAWWNTDKNPPSLCFCSYVCHMIMIKLYRENNLGRRQLINNNYSGFRLNWATEADVVTWHADVFVFHRVGAEDRYQG
jgi:hypothetical protein